MLKQTSPARIIDLVQKRKLDIAVLLIVLILGLLNLSYPFTGDQAFFTVGAQEMSAGEVLYRDFWDLKQPGIFYFYWLAGSLFGFTEPGVHLFELVYLLLASLFLQVSFRQFGYGPVFSACVPLMTVGIYYGVASPYVLTQVEMLVAVPLLIMALVLHWAVSQKEAAMQYWGFLIAGILGGLCLLFKLMFLLIVFPMGFAALIWMVFKQNFFQNKLNVSICALKAALCCLLGGIIPLGLVLIHFYNHESIHILHETFLTYPPEIVSSLPGAPLGRLSRSVIWFVLHFMPLVTFGLLGSIILLKRKLSLLNALLIIWVISGFGVILLQRQAWWVYHFLLVVFPLGILAAIFLQDVWNRFRWHRVRGSGKFKPVKKLLITGTLLVCLSPLVLLGNKAGYFILDSQALFAGDSFVHRTRLNPTYESIAKEVSFLSADDSQPGEIYVCGNPLYYYLSGRRQATTLNGWAMEFFLPNQWLQLIQEVEMTRPPYIFIDVYYQELIKSESADFQQLIQTQFVPLKESEEGIWYMDRQYL